MGERNDLIEMQTRFEDQHPFALTKHDQGLVLAALTFATSSYAGTIARLSEALAEAEKKGAEAHEALTAAQSRLTAIFAIETHSLHVGYDEGSGGGNFVYADVIRTDDPAFVAARDLSQGGQHG